MRFDGRGHDHRSALLALAQKEYLTPLQKFGTTQHVFGRIHKTDEGVYLIVHSNPRAVGHTADDDPVAIAGWARNDYWGARVWGSCRDDQNPFDPDAPTRDEPSLEALGWPHPLRYEATLNRARELAKKPVMVAAQYTMGTPDEMLRGLPAPFRAHVMHAAPRVEFYYDDANPEPTDTPAVIGLKLGGRRYERSKAEHRAKNREWERRNQP